MVVSILETHQVILYSRESCGITDALPNESFCADILSGLAYDEVPVIIQELEVEVGFQQATKVWRMADGGEL